MSQRGMRPVSGRIATTDPASRRVHIGILLALTGALLLTLTLPLNAQNAAPTPPTPCKVTVCVMGVERTVTTGTETVQAFLHEQGIALGDHDRCEPPINAPITDGMTVHVTRITCEWVKERVSIPAPTQVRWNRRMTSHAVVLRQGRPGVVERTRVVWKRDGKVSVAWVQRSTVVAKPVPTILGRGPLASRGVHNMLWVVATAYEPGPKSCGPHATGHTAIGMHAGRGVIAVDPRIIPLGSRVLVEGYGMAIAGDTGGAIHGRRIDVCFKTRWEAKQWGRRLVRVTIMD